MSYTSYTAKAARSSKGALFVLLLALVATSPAQESEVMLKVEGDVQTALALTAGDLARMPRATLTREEDGQTVKYEGVLVRDILQKAGVPLGREMTGKPMASYLLATARDGYQVVFALPEIDPAFMGAEVLAADRRNGVALYPTQRPIQLIAPQDKMRARSVYSLTKLEVVRLRK